MVLNTEQLSSFHGKGGIDLAFFLDLCSQNVQIRVNAHSKIKYSETCRKSGLAESWPGVFE